MRLGIPSTDHRGRQGASFSTTEGETGCSNADGAQSTELEWVSRLSEVSTPGCEAGRKSPNEGREREGSMRTVERWSILTLDEEFHQTLSRPSIELRGPDSSNWLPHYDQICGTTMVLFGSVRFAGVGVPTAVCNDAEALIQPTTGRP